MKNKLFKRAASSLLALSLALTAPISSLANTGGSAAGDNTGGVNTGGGGDFGVNKPSGRIGLRLSLVDSDNPEKVISVVPTEDGKYAPRVVDILYLDEDTWDYYIGGYRTRLTNDNIYTSVKTQDALKTLADANSNVKDANKVKLVFYPDAVKGLKLKSEGEPFENSKNSEIPSWAYYENSSYIANGDQFVAWCKSTGKMDENGEFDQIIGDSGKLYETVDRYGNKIKIEQTSPNQLTIQNGETTYQTTVNAEKYLSSYSNMKSLLDKKKDDLFNIASSPAGYISPESNRQEYLVWFDIMEKAGTIDSGERQQLEDVLQGYWDDYNAKHPSGQKTASNQKNSWFSKVKTAFEPMTAYAAPNDFIPDEDAPSGGGTTVGGGGQNQIEDETSTSPKDAMINRLIDLADKNGDRLLKTESMWTKGTNSIDEAEENWVLLVEPIVFMTIFKPGTDSNSAILRQKVYGTVSNFANALVQNPGGAVASRATNGWFNWKAVNGPLWGALSVSPETKYENPNSASGYGSGFKFNNGWVLTPANNIGKYRSFADLSEANRWKDGGSFFEDGIKYKEGFGVNVWYKDIRGTSQTHTWDKNTYPDGNPGPAPDPTNLPDEDKSYIDKNKNKTLKITKWYYIEDPTTGEQFVYDVNTRPGNPHQVVIENEGTQDSDYIWNVERWASGLEDRVPEDGDTSSTFESYYNTNLGTYNGKEPNILTIKPEDPDKVLYVKLVLRLVPKKKVDIVRVYETPEQPPVIEVESNVKVENNTVDGNSKKPGFNYVENVNTSEPRKDITSWEEVPGGTSGRTPQIPVSETDKTIYIKYEGAPVENPQATGLVLHENEISHQFTLSDVTGSLVEGVQNWSSVSSDASCPYSWTCSDDDCDGHTCGSSYDYTGSEDWSFGIENQPNYNTQFVYKWVQLEPKHWTGGGLSESGGSGKGTPNMTMILQRSISDKVTLYPSKNSNKAALNDMGITSEGYQPANTRKDGLKDVPSRKSWTETFNTNFEFVDVNTPQADFESDHGYTDTDNHTDDGNNASSLNGTYSKSGNTTIYGLWGKENKGDRALTDTAQQNIWKLSTLNFKGFKNHIKEQTFTFYPYYKMKFISQLDGAEQDAYLTAENLSTLFSLQRIDTSIFRPKGATTLELTSSQWSTHAKAHNLLDAAGVENKNSLLPAGAIYDLRTAGSGVKASQSWIGYRVFNSYVMDKNALADATNVKTKQEVVDAVNAFKNDTKNVLSNYEVVMVGQEGINPDDNNGEFYRGSEVITGKDGSYRLGQEFIRDSKYDLQTTGSASGNSSDIDVLEELEETYDWVLTSDADGNVVITRNGTELERLQKNQKNLTNAEVKEFDSRTNIVTNFLSAIDRNMGSDRNGRTWYNEGFSIGCLETRLAYRMGFGDGDASLRSTALNIKANGKLENRNDMFNGDEAKNRSYQFFTSARSTLNGCEKDYVGTYDGIKIFIPNMNQLLVSNRFYTSNTTVMDLN